MKSLAFRETLDLSEAQADNESRVIRNVVLIRAGMSSNRRFYPESVLQKSVNVFEGARAFDSHIRGERRVGELTGFYTNVRYEEGALRADRHFTRTQAGQDVWSVVEDIVSGRAPASLAGLSINAVGQGKPKKFSEGEALEVESITAANSVDDVVNAAAGGTYLTASSGDELTSELLHSMTFEEWFQSRPEFVERVQKEMKTIRQDDAVKAAVAAKDAALAEADHHHRALQEAQAQIEVLMQEREAAVVERDAARRELAIETALSTARLPASWKNGLRESLLKASPDEWQGIIEREVEKSKVQPQRPLVTGAGAQQNAPQQMQEAFDPRPRDGEDSESWARRIASYRR